MMRLSNFTRIDTSFSSFESEKIDREWVGKQSKQN